LANHLAIRDHFRRNQAAAAIYGQLKRQLAARFPMDIDSYTAAKTEFLLQVLQGAGFPEPALSAIRAANQKQ
jgi:GrpB-like predicted nucleotidyltransferase (UPF0157 family)